MSAIMAAFCWTLWHLVLFARKTHDEWTGASLEPLCPESEITVTWVWDEDELLFDGAFGPVGAREEGSA